MLNLPGGVMIGVSDDCKNVVFPGGFGTARSLKLWQKFNPKDVKTSKSLPRQGIM